VSSLPTLGPRGEGWVLIQGVLLVLVVAAGADSLAHGADGTASTVIGPAVSGGVRVVVALIGLAVATAGGVLAVGGVRDLGGSLTPLPHPRDDSQLVETGVYGLVRHPIYGGIVIGASGWALLAASPAALGLSVVLLGFFRLKSAREEAWLEARYPAYPAYRSRTKRMLPLLY
jgi:protein-S-isoprenylcysteine O-methyltransferase Ste14